MNTTGIKAAIIVALSEWKRKKEKEGFIPTVALLIEDLIEETYEVSATTREL